MFGTVTVAVAPKVVVNVMVTWVRVPRAPLNLPNVMFCVGVCGLFVVTVVGGISLSVTVKVTVVGLAKLNDSVCDKLSALTTAQFAKSANAPANRIKNLAFMK